MTATQINARDILVQVQDDDDTTWLDIANVETFTHTPNANEQVTERTSFDSNGLYEGVIMQRGGQIKLEGKRLEDASTGALDSGQERCEALCGETAVGTASLGKLRFRTPAATNWTQWTAFFSLGDQGGGNNDDESWSVTVTKSGASTTVAVS